MMRFIQQFYQDCLVKFALMRTSPSRSCIVRSSSFSICLIMIRSSYNKFVSKKNSLQTYSFLIRQKDNSKHPFRRFFFNHAGSSILCLLVNKLLYSHGPRCYNKLHKNCSYGYCFIAPAKLLLLPRKPAALTLR